jgi:hypothetical protein
MILAIDNAVISGNGNAGTADWAGISAFGFTHVQLSRSTVIGNKFGIQNSTSPNTFYSYGDNHINGNGTDIDSNPGNNPPVTISTE